jgi:hypothetical protein
MRPEVSGGFGIQYLFDFEAGAKQEQHRDSPLQYGVQYI